MNMDELDELFEKMQNSQLPGVLIDLNRTLNYKYNDRAVDLGKKAMVYGTSFEKVDWKKSRVTRGGIMTQSDIVRWLLPRETDLF